MKNNQPQREESKHGQEDNSLRQQQNPFKEAQQERNDTKSLEEEADAEQQYKEALTERD